MKTTFKFSLAQYKSEVPLIIKSFYRILQFISVSVGIFTLYLNIPEDIKLHINTGLLIGNKLIYEFCQFYGIPQPTDSTVEDEKSLATVDKVIEDVKELPKVLPPTLIKPIITIIDNQLTKYTGA